MTLHVPDPLADSRTERTHPADGPTGNDEGSVSVRQVAADREITLEEWIAAGQACCGASDHDA